MPLESPIIHLLLLEDNPDDVFLFTSALRRLRDVKVQVLQVDRLQDAIAILQEQRVDLAVTDLNLPDSVGLDTVKNLIENARGIPVFALTGRSDPELGAQLLAEGVVCHWAKDRLSAAELGKAILDAVTRSREA